MTRSLTLCTFLLSALAIEACNDGPKGSSTTSPRDAAEDITTADRAPSVVPDAAPDVAGDSALEAAPDAAADVAPDVATCSGANPAARTCRETVNSCIPSSCSCAADGKWHCTADCPVNVPLCADGGPPDRALDAVSDTVACTGANLAAQTCRKAVDDCIPSSCSCAADGTWWCTADCLTALPLCTDGGVTTLDARACPAGQVLRYESPGCGAEAKPVCGSGDQDACFRAVCSCQGKTISCCDYASEPFASFGACSDGGDAPVDGPKDVRTDVRTDGTATSDTFNPCARCAANEVCVQSFDGMCHLETAACRLVSETCRSKLSASGVKNCKSIPECESELCLSSMYRCVYDPPCGTEIPAAQVYCYGI